MNGEQLTQAQKDLLRGDNLIRASDFKKLLKKFLPEVIEEQCRNGKIRIDALSIIGRSI